MTLIINEKDLIEKMANLEHNRWSRWMLYLFDQCDFIDGKAIIPVWAVARWQAQMRTEYSDLSEAEKESDRKEARRTLELLMEEFK